MKRLLVSIALVGCAEAGRANSVIGGVGVDGGIPGVDAPVLPEPDASPIDAPPEQLTLTQNASTTILAANSIDCEPFEDMPMRTVANSYYRVFTLADHGVTTTFHITEVMFGIELAKSGMGTSQAATLKLGTYGIAPQDPLDLSQVRNLTSVDIKIADGSLTRMTVPITGDVAPTANLIVELAIPQNDTVNNQFVVGSNQDGERQLAYWRGGMCATVPIGFNQAVQDFDHHDAHIVLTVTGTQGAPES